MNQRKIRHTPRARFSTATRILARDNVVECSIRNMSATGACVSLPGFVPLPSKFVLEVAERKLRYEVALRWKTNDRVGVLFLSSESL